MKKNDIVALCVEEINNLGHGVAHLKNPDGSRGQVVFVTGGVTGDEVDARIIKINKSFLVAKVEKLRKPSPLRTEDTCPAKGCGGCVYRLVRYEHELELKREHVQSAFRKAGLPDVKVGEVRHTGELTEYRNKAQYPVCSGKDGMRVGFYACATHRVVPVRRCQLQPECFGEITDWICSFCDQKGISAYDEETGRGLLRHVYLREGRRSGEVMVCLVVNGKSLPYEGDLAKGLTEAFPFVTGVLLNVNEKNTNVILGEKYRLLTGRDWIEDTLCGLRFRISAGAFYQVNHDACELLYGIARERTALTGKETLLDLYCGIGTIGLSMAHDAKEVIGIEIVEEAVERATENAVLNGIGNAFFYCGDATDARRLLENAEESRGRIEDATVILDPPRKGSTPELISYLAGRGFSRIVYVSCNPDTLARDCALFAELGYDIGEVTPVDMFPRTGHVESVVCLER